MEVKPFLFIFLPIFSLSTFQINTVSHNCKDSTHSVKHTAPFSSSVGTSVLVTYMLS